MDREPRATMYSVGDCSICAGGGAAVVVAPIPAGDLFFACPACGCAWSEPPVAHVVDTIDPATSFAPQGFRLASREEIERAGLTHLIVAEYSGDSMCTFDGDEGFKP